MESDQHVRINFKQLFTVDPQAEKQWVQQINRKFPFKPQTVFTRNTQP